MDDFVVASAAAQVPCPARMARLLAVNVALGEPKVLSLPVNAGLKIAHGTHLVVHEAVASGHRLIPRCP
jgi:hypothetical protein